MSLTDVIHFREFISSRRKLVAAFQVSVDGKNFKFTNAQDFVQKLNDLLRQQHFSVRVSSGSPNVVHVWSGQEIQVPIDHSDRLGQEQ